ncbi:MAG: hypothetical protein ACLFS3_01955 [Candidatus Aenigmatarchaeota archaeon]
MPKRIITTEDICPSPTHDVYFEQTGNRIMVMETIEGTPGYQAIIDFDREKEVMDIYVNGVGVESAERFPELFDHKEKNVYAPWL